MERNRMRREWRIRGGGGCGSATSNSTRYHCLRTIAADSVNVDCTCVGTQLSAYDKQLPQPTCFCSNCRHAVSTIREVARAQQVEYLIEEHGGHLDAGSWVATRIVAMSVWLVRVRGGRVGRRLVVE